MSRYLLMVFGLALVSCGQRLAEPLPPLPDPLPQLRTAALGESLNLDGQLDKWPAGKVADIKLYYNKPAQGQVELDGSWTVVIPAVADDKLSSGFGIYVGPSKDDAGQPCDLNTVQMTPLNARSTRTTLVLHTKPTGIRSQTSYVPPLPQIGRLDYNGALQARREVDLVYVPVSTRVRGQYICRVYRWTGTPVTASSKFDYRSVSVNLDLKVGWNEVLTTTSYGQTEPFVTRTVVEGGAGQPPVSWAYNGEPLRPPNE